MTVPTAGSPATVNGAAGGVTAVTVSLAVPVLPTITVRVGLVVVGTGTKSSVAGAAARPGVVPPPCRSTSAGPRSVATVRVAVAGPALTGSYRIGMSSAAPASSVRGRPAGSALNGEPVLTPVTVTG